MSFSSDIKKVRQKSLLSQEAFAQAVGVSFTTVNRWESGKCKPTFKTMKLIDEFCNLKNKNGEIICLQRLNYLQVQVVLHWE